MRDELYEPLGLGAGPALSSPARPARAGMALAAAAAVLAALGAHALIGREAPFGGEPFAIAKVEVAPDPPPAAAAAPAAPAAVNSSAASMERPAPAIASADQVEAASGVKVTRVGGGSAPGAVIIDVARALALRLDPAPDPRLVETSRYGLLPRVGADGARPFEVYARAVMLDQRLKAGAPRIALMVGGLGLNPEGAQAAIANLPGAVTLGFAPYGAAVDRQAADAREAGHEIVLQAPMEDFSGDKPGPFTLKTAASAPENLDALHWLMSRFAGYVAVANHLGGRFTADERALSPVLADIAARGLGYFDDGSSPRSVAPDVAATLPMPSARADVAIDAGASPQSFDAALARLLDLARERGAAIGVASASPASVERLARWAAALEAKGVALVPLSALMAKAPNASAEASP